MSCSCAIVDRIDRETERQRRNQIKRDRKCSLYDKKMCLVFTFSMILIRSISISHHIDPYIYCPRAFITMAQYFLWCETRNVFFWSFPCVCSISKWQHIWTVYNAMKALLVSVSNTLQEMFDFWQNFKCGLRFVVAEFWILIANNSYNLINYNKCDGKDGYRVSMGGNGGIKREMKRERTGEKRQTRPMETMCGRTDK